MKLNTSESAIWCLSRRSDQELGRKHLEEEEGKNE